MFSNNEAFGLPAGTIRAALAIGTVGAFLYGCLTGVNPTILGMMSAIAVMIIKDYFDKGKYNTNKEDVKDENQ